MLLVAPENLVSGFPGDAELPTHMAHRLAFQKAGNETQALVHDRTLFPRHRHLPPAIAGGRCYPCVRNKTSPMSRVGHPALVQRFSVGALPPTMRSIRPVTSGWRPVAS